MLEDDYIDVALNPANKKTSIPTHFQEGVKNILGRHTTSLSGEHVLLSMDKKFQSSGLGQNFIPIVYALINTMFLSGIKIGIDKGIKVKEIVGGILRGLSHDFADILKFPKSWIMISNFSDQYFIHNVLKVYFPSTVRFCEAIYIGTKEERITTHDCFFKENYLRVTTCIFFQ